MSPGRRRRFRVGPALGFGVPGLVARALAVLGLGACGVPSGGAPLAHPARPAELLGQRAPVVVGEVVAGAGRGEMLDWEAFQGQVLIVDFWATWCVPCRRSLPYLQALAERQPVALGVIGVSEDETAARIPGFVARYALEFPSVWDEDESIAVAYGVTGLPTTVVIDHERVVRHVRSGFRQGDEEDLEGVLGRLLDAARQSPR